MRPRRPARAPARPIEVAVAVQHQPDAGRERRAVHVIGQAADAGRTAAADRQIEDLLGDLGHAVENRAAAGQHDPGVEALLVAGAADLVPHQVEDLLGARLQNLRQDAARHHARLAAADARHLHRLVLVHHAGQRAAALALDLFRVGHRRAQADGDVVGEVIAADADDGRVPQAAALVDRDVGGAAADVDQRDAELLLVLGQHRFAGRELLDDRLGDVDAGPVHARDDVLRRALAAGDDVDVHFEPGAGHADRRADAVLLVDDEVLRQHVQDLAAGRQRHRLGRVDRAPDVLARDLAVLAGHRDHAAAVEPLDVRAGQREVHRVDLDAGHQLGFLDRLLDRVDRRLEVDDDAAPDAARLGDAEADDVEPVAVENLADDGRHLRRADVEPDQIPLFSRHSSSESCCVRLPGVAAAGSARPPRSSPCAGRT